MVVPGSTPTPSPVHTIRLVSLPLNAGITEVFTDEQNNRYGTEFGSTLTSASGYVLDKGRRRNRLYANRAKAVAKGDWRKPVTSLNITWAKRNRLHIGSSCGRK